MALLDLDHFNQINERLGRVAVTALRAVAQAAGEVLRGQERIGRWGGDEWLLVMPGTAIDEMPEVFERLRAGRRAAPAILPAPHGVTLSMGAAAWRGLRSVEALVEEAERQLLRAKAEGVTACAAHARAALVMPAPRPRRARTRSGAPGRVGLRQPVIAFQPCPMPSPAARCARRPAACRSGRMRHGA